MADREREVLGLLERLFLRLGFTETDEQLEATLSTFLVPVILKLSEPSKLVHQKVLELLTHVNKRVKNRPIIKLPVSELLKHLSDFDTSPFVYNFLVVYVKMGYIRMSPEKQVELMPELVQSFKGRSQNQLNILLQLFMNCLLHIKPSSSDQEKLSCFLSQLPTDAISMVLNSMLNFLFLPYNISQEVGEVSPGSPLPVVPPGMSETSLKTLVGEVPLKCDDVEKIKVSIVHVIGSGIFPSRDISCHLLVSSVDVRHSVVNVAEIRLKQLVSIEEWNSTEVVRKLYDIFLGTTIAERNIKPADKKMPCNVQLRGKILNVLMKCSEASKCFPAPIQVVYESLFSTNTTSKLKLSALQFVHHLCFSSPQQNFDLMSAMLNSAVMKIIQNENEDVKVQGQAYLALGRIGRRSPTVVAKNISFVKQLFDALTLRNEELVSSIQECLMMVSPAFSDIDPATSLLLEAIILQHIDEGSCTSRLVSVRYASTVFPSNHLPSRYALLLACGDEKEEVSNEAMRSLNIEDASLPSFVDFIKFISLKVDSRHYVVGNKSLPFKRATYFELLKYGRRCLHGDAMLYYGIQHLQSSHIAKFAATLILDVDNPIKIFTTLMVNFLSVFTEASVLHCLLETVAITKDMMSYQFLEAETWLKEAMYSSVDETSRCAAEIISIVMIQNKLLIELQSFLACLVADFSCQTLEKQQGSILCYGFVMNKLAMQQGLHFDELGVLHNAALKFIADKLNNTQQPSLSLAAYCCFVELARCGLLSRIPDDDDKHYVSKLSLVCLLLAKLQSSKEIPKVRENAAHCLAMLCVGEANFRYKQRIIEGLLASAEAKQYELHCAVGEALVLVGQGSRSSKGRDKWLSQEEDVKPALDDPSTDVSIILELLLTKYISNVNPHFRQVGCIWLSTLVGKVGDWPEVQGQLMKIQTAFMSLLGESDDLTQDVVSRGLSMVYEKGSTDVKKELVSCLVDSLTSGKRRKLDVHSDTPVFQEGFLGKTPEGQNISTYKELCSIANDLNQPDLIYKFMNLANHNASWNLKRGAAQGFINIASQASEQLAPHLDKILPKLYRHQYDPNPRIRSAMQSIWISLVSDQDKTLNKYMTEIVGDLKINMTNPQWRIRESSCLALSDFLKGRHLEGAEDFLPEVWKISFRVRDDIKESVRKAAELTLQSLSKATIRMCDCSAGQTSSATKTTSLLLPVLLESGLTSNVDEVRSVSLKTLMEVSKSAGDLLKPHITNLVVALLESISTLEPQFLNYLTLHAASNQSALDVIDKARVSSYKSSPMMEVVNHCIQMTDTTILSSLIPKLIDLLKTSVGLGSKICASSVIISLVQKCPQDLAPHTGKLLATLVAGLTDKNASLRRSYAVAIGHLAKISKDSSVEKLILKLRQWYFEKDDEIVRECCEMAIHSINNVNPDITKKHSTVILPFVFFGMHAIKSQETSSLSPGNLHWAEVWQEATPTTEIGLKLYCSEVVELIQKSLESPSWTIRSQGAWTMLALVKNLSDHIPYRHMQVLISSVLAALPGRTWSGKDTLLKVLSTLFTSHRNLCEENHLNIDDVVSAILKECRKDGLKYKTEAINCLASIVDTLQVNKFIEVLQLLVPIIKKKVNNDDEPDEEANDSLRQELLKTSFDALSRCWPMKWEYQELHQAEVCRIFTESAGCNSWRVEVSVLRSISRFIQRWLIFENYSSKKHENFLQNFLSSLIPIFCRFLSDSKNSTLRAETISVIEVIFKRIGECSHAHLHILHKDELTANLTHISTSDSMMELRMKAKTLLQAFPHDSNF